MKGLDCVSKQEVSSINDVETNELIKCPVLILYYK